MKQALRPNWRRKARKGKAKDMRGRIPVTFTIHDRPEAANRREQLGDWEADTIKSLSMGGLVTLVERKTRLLLATKLPSLSADSLNRALLKLLNGLPAGCAKTLTVDSGAEFSGYRNWRPSARRRRRAYQHQAQKTL